MSAHKARVYKRILPLVNATSETIVSGRRYLDCPSYVNAVGGISSIRKPSSDASNHETDEAVKALIRETPLFDPADKTKTCTVAEYETGAYNPPTVPLGFIDIKKFIENSRIKDMPYVRIGTYENTILAGQKEDINFWAEMPNVLEIAEKAKILVDEIVDEDGYVAFGLPLKSVSEFMQRDDYSYKTTRGVIDGTGIFKVVSASNNLSLTKATTYTDNYDGEGYLSSEKVSGMLLPEWKYAESAIGGSMLVRYMPATSPVTLYTDTPYETTVDNVLYMDYKGIADLTVDALEVYTYDDDGSRVATNAKALAVSNWMASTRAKSTALLDIGTFTPDMNVVATKSQAIFDDNYTKYDAMLEMVFPLIRLAHSDLLSDNNNRGLPTTMYMTISDFKELFEYLLLDIQYNVQLYEEFLESVEEDPIGKLLSMTGNLVQYLDIDTQRINHLSMTFTIHNIGGGSYLNEVNYPSDRSVFVDVIKVLGSNTLKKILIPIGQYYVDENVYYVHSYILNWKELKKLSAYEFVMVLEAFYGYIHSNTPKKKKDTFGTIVKIVITIVAAYYMGPAGAASLWSTTATLLYYVGMAALAVGMLTENKTLMLIGSLLMAAGSFVNALNTTGFNLNVVQGLSYVLKLATYVDEYRYDKKIKELNNRTKALSEVVDEIEELVTQFELAKKIDKFVYEDNHTNRYNDFYEYRYEYSYL